VGVWLNDTKDAQIEMFKKDGKYFSKIVWAQNAIKEDGTSHTDMKNPDPKLRKREIIGMEMISNLKYKKGKWVGGDLYVVKKGRTVNCKMEISEDNKQLYVTVYKAMFFSRTVAWTRVDENEEK
jgi:uncharacterized protein (DUF2147 family)